MSDESLFCPQCGTLLEGGARRCPNDHGIAGGVYGVTRDALEATPRAKRHLLGVEVNQAYIIDGYLGSGGFGAVYKAVQKALARPVALKLLVLESGTEETVIERFKREARTAAQILDPNVVTLFDYGEAALGEHESDRMLYMAMELIDGPTLRRVIKRSKGLGLDASLKVGVAILRGLAAAHQMGVVHRDLKPSNVLIDESKGREWHARLFDFGIASLQGAGNQTQLTSEGGVLGTPKYMAPEQWRALPTTPATDVYAFGCILAEMLTGQPPVPKMELAEMARAHCRGPRPHVTMTSKGEPVPVALTNFIKRCTAVDPTKRYGVAQEALEVFESIDRGRDAAPVPHVPEGAPWPEDPSGSDVGPMLGPEPEGMPPAAAMASSAELPAVHATPSERHSGHYSGSYGSQHSVSLPTDPFAGDNANPSQSQSMSWASVSTEPERPSRKALIFGGLGLLAAGAIIALSLRSPQTLPVMGAAAPSPAPSPALPPVAGGEQALLTPTAPSGGGGAPARPAPVEAAPTKSGPGASLAAGQPERAPSAVSPGEAGAADGGITQIAAGEEKAQARAQAPGEPTPAEPTPSEAIPAEKSKPVAKTVKKPKRRGRVKRPRSNLVDAPTGKPAEAAPEAIAKVADKQPEAAPAQAPAAAAMKLFARAKEADRRGAPRSARRFYEQALGEGLAGAEAQEAQRRIKALQSTLVKGRKEF